MRSAAFLACVACAGSPAGPDVSDSGAWVPDTPEPAACAEPTLRVAQELAAVDVVAPNAGEEATTPTWADDPSWGGPGVALADLDDDGWLDAVLATPTGESRVLWNDGAGALVPDPAWTVPAALAVALADFDGDGVLDAWLGRRDGLPDLVLTEGFTVRTELEASDGYSVTGSVADYDGDGDVDLFVARHVAHPDIDAILAGGVQGGGNVLYRNDGGALVDESASLPPELLDGLSFQGAWLDADEDRDLDLYLVNDFGAYIDPNALLRREAEAFERVPACGCELAIFGMGAAIADYDGDGRVDLFVTDIGSPSLLLGDGAGGWYDAALAHGVDIPFDADHMAAWGTTPVDLDLDGQVDIAAVYGPTEFWHDPFPIQDSDGNSATESMVQRDVLLRNHDGAFADEAAIGFDDTRVGRAVAVGDLDRDGRPDLVTAGWERTGEPFVRVSLGEGGCGGGVTVAGAMTDVGTRVDTEVQGRTHTRWLLPSTTFSQSAPELHLGLGGRPRADRITVTWPGGTEVVVEDVPAGTTLTLADLAR